MDDKAIVSDNATIRRPSLACNRIAGGVTAGRCLHRQERLARLVLISFAQVAWT